MTTQAQVTAANIVNDELLNELLQDLDSTDVQKALASIEPVKAAPDEVIEEQDPVVGAVADNAVGEVKDPIDDIITEAAANALPEIAPVTGKGKGRGKKTPEVKADAAPVPAKPKGKRKSANTVPAGYGSDAEPPKDTSVEPAKKAAKEPKAPKEKKEAAPKEPKPTRATSITHRPGDLLLVRLGEKANDLLTFSIKANDEQAATARQDFITRMNNNDAIATKVREKILMFMGWISTEGTELNKVMARSLELLHDKGELTSGDKGNLHINLCAVPYSNGTARSQGNQMFMAFPELGLTVKEKGKMIPNEDSPLLQAAYAKLGLK